MKILLVNPPSGDLTIGLKYLAKVEPLGLEIIGAAVPDHEVRLLDMEVDRDLEGTLQHFQPDVVGTSAQVVQTYTAQLVLKTAKRYNPEVLNLLGGHHATLCPEEFANPFIDAIVLGEGVPAFQEIIARHELGRSLNEVAGLAFPRNGHLQYTPTRPLPASLDHQPLPDRSLTEAYRSHYFYLFESPVASIQTSMGCTFACNFCSCQKFTRRHFIPRSPELIVEDLCSIDEKFVMFCDDHSFVDAKRMNRLYDLIVEQGIHKRYFAYTRADCVVQNPSLFEKWAGIGLELVMTGLEAVDDSSINTLNKGTNVSINEQAVEILRRCGINLSAGFVVMPDYTESDFERIDAYVQKRPNIVLTELTPLTPLPGTDLYDEQKGKLTTQHREMFDLAHFTLSTSLPLRDMYHLLRKYYFRAIWRAVNRLHLYRPRYLFKRHIWRLAIGAWRVAGMIGRAHQHTEQPTIGDSI